MLKGSQGFIPFDGRRIWCGVVGEGGDRPPVVCVPGGPGMSHDYLGNLAALARDGRRVVFYDALGSGRSDRERPGGAPWTQAIYVDEIAAVCRHLGLERYHLFAASAAGLAAFPHALARPPGLVSMVLSGTPASLPAHTRHLEELLVGLGVARHELARFDAAPMLRARDARIYHEFSARYMCRARPIPDVLLQAARTMNAAANVALKGGRIFYTSSLRDWDVSDRLGEIAVPALFTCGQEELLPRAMCEDIARRIPRCELMVFEHSGHVPHLDEPGNYVARVAEFLRRHDRAA